MMRKYHFIAGLPRSGSTLLSSILNQNPRFSASISDPLISYVRSIVQKTDPASGMHTLVPVSTQKRIMHAIVDAYYANHNQVCFNTNRSWSAHTELIHDLYPQARIILCVRHVCWILDSFERLHTQTPYALKSVYGNQDLPTVYHRAHSLMDVNSGGSAIVGMSLLNTKQALYSAQQSQICVIDYDVLCAHPDQVMRSLYDFLDEPMYDHDYSDVATQYDMYDEALNMSGLHRVRSKVEKHARTSILPDDLWHTYETECFWHENFDHIKNKVKWWAS